MPRSFKKGAFDAWKHFFEYRSWADMTPEAENK